jgi:hypothetical protein
VRRARLTAFQKACRSCTSSRRDSRPRGTPGSIRSSERPRWCPIGHEVGEGPLLVRRPPTRKALALADTAKASGYRLRILIELDGCDVYLLPVTRAETPPEVHLLGRDYRHDVGENEAHRLRWLPPVGPGGGASVSRAWPRSMPSLATARRRRLRLGGLDRDGSLTTAARAFLSRLVLVSAPSRSGACPPSGSGRGPAPCRRRR